MSKRFSVPALCGLLILIVTGCSTVEPGKRSGQVRIENLKSAYIITPPNANLTVSRHIGEALIKRGVTVRAGALDAKPADIDFSVAYTDVWKWDLSMYLHSLDIQFKDGATGQLIASGAFRQGLIHDYSELEPTVYKVIDRIYKAK